MTLPRMLPPGAEPFSQKRAAVLIAVIEQRRPTVKSVGEYAGTGPAETHRYLTDLRRLGLIAWEQGRAGTLHALVEIVPQDGRR